MSAAKPKNVAIVGAGLSGMSLALELHRRGIQTTLYELRKPTFTTHGALMLSPNALRIMDKLGLYARVRGKGFPFEALTFMDANESNIGHYYLASERMYGYKGLRLYRQLLLDELRMMVGEAGIPIVYEKKFSKVVEERIESVTFHFEDGTIASADLLVGADGVHSAVRRQAIAPVSPQYSGMVAITCALRKASLGPDKQDYPLPVTIFGKPGAWGMAPQSADGEERLAGLQVPWPEQDRGGWDEFLADKERLLQIMRKDYGDWPPTLQAAMDGIPEVKQSISTWPFYTMPKLERWSSKSNRVIILGDAAHAIPPTAGQGANQAFEDAHTLALILSNISQTLTLEESVANWKHNRQARIDKVIKLTLQINNMRLPLVEREKLPPDAFSKSDEGAQLMWLYGRDVGEEYQDSLS